MMSFVALLFLLCLPVVAIFFAYAAARRKFTIVFLVSIMTVATALVGTGISMIMHRETTWEGVVLTCFCLTFLLAAMVVCLIFCQGEATTRDNR